MFTEEEKGFLEATGLEQVKEFIQNTFKSKATGNSQMYNSLVQQLRTRDDPDTLWKIYLSLPSRLNLITSRPEVYRELIQSLYTFDWIAEKKIIVAFMNLVSLFVSSNPIFLIPSLQMLVKNLVPQLPSSPGLPETPTPSLSEEYFLELKQRQEFLHRTIQIIFRLAPGAMLEIHPILVDNFPHKRLSCHVQQEYVTQLLLLCESFPQLQGRIIELIFTKCLELDVDIVIEDSGEVHISAEADEDDEASEFFQLDDNPDQDSFKSLRRRAGMGEEGAMKIRDDVSETAQKLDSILAILLSFIRATQERSEALATPETDLSQLLSVKLFKQMLDAFELRVMTTYKAKYVQFALFYSCQLSPPLGVIYLQRLSRLFLDPSNHPLSRQSAVVYLSSLIARGQFVSFHTSREYLSLLLQWASKYVQQRGQESIPKGVTLQRIDSDVLADYTSYLESATLGAYGRQQQLHGSHLLDEFGRKVITDYDSLARHETFFCCVQSLCYAICFLGISMAQMMATESLEKHSWEVVLHSEFHPLRYCIPTVRTEFLRIAAAGGLLSSSLTHGSGRVSSNLSSAGSGSHNPLDTFFPFDPCLLLQVHEFIKDGYRIWENEVVLNDPEEEEEEEDSEEESEGEDNLQEESVEDCGSGMLSSVASSIASMAFSCGGDGMNISLSVGGMGNASPATAALMGTVSTVGRGAMLKKSVLQQQLGTGAGTPPSASSPYGLTSHEGMGMAGEGGEDAWIAMMRSKRSRQFSVGSAGSW